MNVKFVFKEFKLLILICSIVLLVSFCIGLFTSGQAQVDKSLLRLGYISILKNNLLAALNLSSGLFTFGLSSLISLIINGLVIGNAVKSSSYFLHWYEIILRILPHGIFEIPGIIIASTVGLSPIKLIFDLVKGKKIELRLYVNQLFILISISVILIVIAAFVEAFISDYFVNVG
ncbi:stage II sporulation protein M [Bacillus siamensis]|uniref:stage II sporulation protein M n=1 Tax=Bacillus TaxID=1386 RepID=UPI002E212156|nr:stage II sporulation protein M [Bacillus siamensis]MED0777950.1 stage II sporulation protein M [Bacillus siamensis]MED0781879.1 stage II sporulation protein M [Bacillus siamensis]MED0836466.1 stage II sporulation protein M [Bacillus siamensis]